VASHPEKQKGRVQLIAFLSTVALAKVEATGCYNTIMYYVYLLKLADGSVYTGSTKDIKNRIAKHNKGDVLATKGKRPIRLVFYCAFASKEKAIEFEMYLKSGSGQSFRNKHLI